jgi:hypothetical protein
MLISPLCLGLPSCLFFFEIYLNIAAIGGEPLWLVFEMFCICISDRMAGILIESLRSFSQSLQENVECNLKFIQRNSRITVPTPSNYCKHTFKLL